ncbi:hypothetical protein PHSC3_000892 [Chlamydiales bacterium STE3]|nr:hypothetical protein PHSC3_000892 [Chlamydiales bacterium STE3]
MLSEKNLLKTPIGLVKCHSQYRKSLKAAWLAASSVLPSLKIPKAIIWPSKPIIK